MYDRRLAKRQQKPCLEKGLSSWREMAVGEILIGDNRKTEQLT